MPELGVAITILSFVTAQRLVELVYARRNEVRNYAIVTAEILVLAMVFGPCARMASRSPWPIQAFLPFAFRRKSKRWKARLCRRAS